jgi:hypothetical protein
VWWVERPGTQSNLKPIPGINHECITSKLFVITEIFTFVGKTNNFVVLNNLLLYTKFVQKLLEYLEKNKPSSGLVLPVNGVLVVL